MVFSQDNAEFMMSVLGEVLSETFCQQQAIATD
jgi:hypothetical protein